MRGTGKAVALTVLLLSAVACAVQPVGDGTLPPVTPVPPEIVLPDPDPDARRTIVSYLPDTSDFSNPERGFHEEMSLLTDRAVTVSGSISLVRGLVRLDDFRDSDLPADLLQDLQLGFDTVRRSGVKVIPRFMYNSGVDRDAPLTSVMRHIEQLSPILRANADVIAVLHAGFIGRWGEWHHSEYDLTTPENKRRIALALLDALPDERMLQIRSPWHMRHVLDSHELFDPAMAFNGSAQSRIGLLNDCFLAAADDAGTFDGQEFIEYAQAMAPFTVTGGETCSIPPVDNRQECPNALRELALYGWDYLNLGYNRDVLDKWRTGGCFDEISRRLGYRFELQQAALDIPDSGGAATLRLSIRNTGFGKLYNPRPLQVILTSQTGASRTVTVASDARQIMPLSGALTTIAVALPADMAAGTWHISVALPDGSPSLQDNPDYSIRFASLDEMSGASIWQPASGTNRLGLSLTLQPD